ncbi:MAG: 1-(5-phosphoribosyl)-5-[(5-phosphoribosylamino)methylideneamino]imidazole-4-carboxamide isomerase [Pseudomonadota bacterium]
MHLFPAIDLKDGACVRLRQGEMDDATVFSESPAAQAIDFTNAGAKWLHIVDLNGAFAGHTVNGKAVEAVLDQIDIPVQLGGGIRTEADIERWLDRGIARVILGTVAVRDPDLVRRAAWRWPGQIVVGIDARKGQVAVEGWAETSELHAHQLANAFADAGVAAIIFTDIDRDGLLGGVNVAATQALAEAVDIPIIASGGVAGMADIEAVARAARDTTGTIDGVIAGRAIYDGRLDLKAALTWIENNADEPISRC